MKRTCKTAIVLMLIASVMMLASCDGLFTTSMMSGAARDPSKAAKALAKKPTDDLVNDAAGAADRAQATAVVEALSKKNPDEIKNLSDDQKKTVITAATTAVIDLTSLGGSLGEVMNGDGSGNEDEMMQNIVGDLIGGLGDVDTTCVAVILDDSLNTDGTLKDDVPEDMYGSLTLGAVTVAASAIKGAKGDDFDAAEVLAAFDGSGSSTAEALLGPDATNEQIANLTTALNTLAAVQSKGYDFTSAFGLGA